LPKIFEGLVDDVEGAALAVPVAEGAAPKGDFVLSDPLVVVGPKLKEGGLD